MKDNYLQKLSKEELVKIVNGQTTLNGVVILSFVMFGIIIVSEITHVLILYWSHRLVYGEYSQGIGIGFCIGAIFVSSSISLRTNTQLAALIQLLRRSGVIM